MLLRAFFIVTCLMAASGLARGEPRRELSFRDALALALAHNGELYVARADTEIADDDVALARSVFDPRLIATARVGRDDELRNPFRFNFTDDILTGSLAVTGRAGTGLTYTLAVASTFEKYESPFVSIYNPANTTTVTLSLTQPLLRNAWGAANHRPIVVASLRRDLTEQQLRVRLELIVSAVEVAYWSLALARNEVQARQASLELAEQQLLESKRL